MYYLPITSAHKLKLIYISLVTNRNIRILGALISHYSIGPKKTKIQNLKLEFKNKTQTDIQVFFKRSLNFGWRQYHDKIWMKRSVYSLFLPVKMQRF